MTDLENHRQPRWVAFVNRRGEGWRRQDGRRRARRA